MNHTEQNIFFEILQAALWQREVSLSVFSNGAYDWKNIVECLERHALLGVAAEPCMQFPEVKERFLMHRLALYERHKKINETICYFLKQAQAANARAVLLKGQSLAALYPVPEARSCGDIDFFVGRRKGINGEEIMDPHNIHWTVKHNGIKLELHYLAADTAIPEIKDDYNRWAEQQLFASRETIGINGMRIPVPTTEFYMIYVFEHLLKHLRHEGVGLRQFADWMMVIRSAVKAGYDSGQLLGNLRRFRLLNAWQVLGGILVWQLGLPCEQFPFWDERKARHSQGRSLSYIIDAGNFGENLKNVKGYFFMPPSLKRRYFALKFYLPVIRFEYHLFGFSAFNRFHVW